MFDLSAIQSALRELGLDGWLLYDFRGTNVLARRVLGFDEGQMGSRRFFYCVPAEGEPQKLVHRIESGALDHLPGSKRVYLPWQQLEEELAAMLAGLNTVAMEYAPRGSNPYISRVDAGTIELVRSAGAEVVSSGDLVQHFEATWEDAQWDTHRRADGITRGAFDAAWGLIAERVRAAGSVLESEVIRRILDHFDAHQAIPDHDPIVAVGPHSGDPHYQTTPATDTPIRKGDFVLIDLWCRLDEPRSVFSDVTRVGFVSKEVPEQYDRVFQVVAAARDAAIEFVRRRMAEDRPTQGWEVDDATRAVIEAAGYGEFFVHRTGHSIGQEIHGNGANMDNLETHDERRVMRRTCFSIEPGIYQPQFGIRSEVDVFIDATGAVHVTGGELQREVLAILAEY